MARKPEKPETPEGKTPAKRDMEQEMLMREVDEAVRHEQVNTAFQRYGLIVGVVLVLALAGFAGYLYWQGESESAMERDSEQLIAAMDEFEAGNENIADEELAALAEDAGPGAAASALMMRAAIAVNDGRTEDAAALYELVATDDEMPDPLRQAADIRAVALQFEELEPQEVIDRLGPLATPESAWFGSAGELVAMAYLARGDEERAGPLLAEIAKAEDVPQTLRSRTRQLAGLLGYDAIEDVDETLEEMGSAEPGDPAAAGTAPQQ